jgi:hypothetical protein
LKEPNSEDDGGSFPEIMSPAYQIVAPQERTKYGLERSGQAKGHGFEILERSRFTQ